jgi:hypothetical protein
MSTVEPDGDDVVSMLPIHNLIGDRISRFNTIDQALKNQLRSSISSNWFKEGIECEFLKASTGGGWQKGKIRVREFFLRLEFVPDVPDEPEPSTELFPEQ